MYPEKLDFLVCHKDQGELNQNFRGSLLRSYKEKAAKQIVKTNSPVWQKAGVLLSRGGNCHAHGYGPGPN